MQKFARFIMEGKIPAEIWVFLSSLFLAFNSSIYNLIFTDENLPLNLMLVVNFIFFLLLSAPLAIGILRFSYARSLLFILALVAPMGFSGNFALLEFFAGVVIFAYLLRILRNLGLGLILTALAFLPLSNYLEFMSVEDKESIARSVLSFKVEKQMSENVKIEAEELKQKFKPEQVKSFIQMFDILIISSLFIMNILMVLFARWLQSLLYYPGGFKKEFLDLKINFWFSIGTILLTIAIMTLLDDGSKFIGVLFLPYFFAGLALIHYIFNIKNYSKNMLIGFYIGLFIFPQVLGFFLILAGFLDALADFRKRIEA